MRQGQGGWAPPLAAPPALRPSVLPRAVHRVLRVLEEAGVPAVVVGGTVRDLLLGRPVHDYDVASPLPPDEAARVLRQAGFLVVPTGLRYGTVTAYAEDQLGVQVTTFRREQGYADARHPDRVEWTHDVEEDLSRRDFTVNAMAWRPLYGQGRGVLYDPFGGRHDLGRRLLRAVGDPVERLREDPLRIARLYRLAAQLDFRLEKATEQAAREAAPLLAKVSRERVRDELDRLLLAPYPSRVEEGVARVLLPAAIPLWQELVDFEASGWRGALVQAPSVRHTPVDLHSLRTAAAVGPDRVLKWAALLHDLGKPRCFSLSPQGRVQFHGHEAVSALLAREAMNELRLSTRLVQEACELIEVHLFPWEEAGPAGYRRLLRRLGPQGVRRLLELHRADVEATTPLGWPAYSQVAQEVEELLASRPAVREEALAVNGHDVMAILGIGPGPTVGQVLRTLMEHVLEHPEDNTRDKLVALIAQGDWGRPHPHGRSSP
jgi:tRNA nucleotidyltransferase (CCA-adding enzyme)